MAIICNQIFSSDIFNSHGKSKLMTSELSMLRDKVYNQMYDDACDVGFGIHSKRTGQITYWSYHSDERDGEGNLQGLNFKPIPETLRKFPALKSWTVHVFND